MPWGRVSIVPFLSSKIDGGEWSASSPCRPIPSETVPSIHHMGGWVGLRAGLHVMKKSVLPMLGIEPQLFYLYYMFYILGSMELT
jgi:hypothetical protein